MKRPCFLTAQEEEVDRISSLPDPIRSHILSYLPTEHAVSTSILSKQWRDLSASLPNLDFNQWRAPNMLSNPKQFQEFVNTILSRRGRLDIDNFSLDTRADNEFISTEDISKWISFAGEHHVRKLYLCSKFFNFQFSNFNFTTLTLLSLTSTCICLPTVFILPLLKTLILDYVIFSANEVVDDEIVSVETGVFTCNCPMLSSFSLSNPILRHFSTLSILVTNATDIKLFDVNDYAGIKFHLSVPNLLEMIYRGNFPPKLNLETMSSTHTADILFKSPDCNAHEEFSHVSTTKLLMGLHNVKHLILRDYVVELLTRDRGLSAALPSSFYSLKHLELYISPVKNHVLVLTLLMRCVPKLKSLCIQVQECFTSLNTHDMEVHWKTGELPREDKLGLLKQATFYGFTGSEVELEIVRYILEKASILSTLKISYSMVNEISEESYIRTSDKIMAFSRESPHVAISQYHSSACIINGLRTG